MKMRRAPPRQARPGGDFKADFELRRSVDLPARPVRRVAPQIAFGSDADRRPTDGLPAEKDQIVGFWSSRSLKWDEEHLLILAMQIILNSLVRKVRGLYLPRAPSCLPDERHGPGAALAPPWRRLTPR